MIYICESFVAAVLLVQQHHNTINSMHLLAYIYKDMDRTDKAVELMKRVVKLRSRTIGSDHLDTLASIDVLKRWTGT